MKRPARRSSRQDDRPTPGFRAAILPILFLMGLVGYGLMYRPLVQELDALPLELIFVLAATFAVTQLLILGYSWETIQESVVSKLARALPAFFILFSIGIIIAAWMVGGTIPMLVYYGLGLIDPQYLYLLSFLIPIVFSTLTGTSWGSAGTIGVVLIGIATVVQADLGITAGAIIGGAYFGDKLSPLSDTTNLAALATDVDLFDHIRSMTVTTIPSALLAAISFTILGFTHAPGLVGAELTRLEPFLESLRELFRFNILLLLPPVIVLVGSLRKKPTIPILLTSALCAALLAVIFQPYSVGDVLGSMNRGFNVDMAPWATDLPDETVSLVNRGGLYSMSEAIFVAFLVFFFIGAIDTIDAMRTVVERVFRFAATRRAAILSALGASGITNALTSNQYATTFIVGDAFRSRFDALRIPRKVLSRSLEDYGTMIESIIPWTSTTIFMVATLGVPHAEYWNWQLMTLFNLVVAPTVAILGIGCFYHEMDGHEVNGTDDGKV